VPRRFARRAERASDTDSFDPNQSEPEHGKRDGERQGSAEQKEPGARKGRHSACLTDGKRKRARIGGKEEPSNDDESEKDGTAGKEVDHGIRPSAELLEQAQGRAALRRLAEILQRLPPASGIDRNGG
jgi:hypothetical protein